MEGIMKQSRDEVEVEEVGLLRRQAHEQVVTTTNATVTDITASYIDIPGQEISETKDTSNFSEAEKKNITSPFSDSANSRVLTSSDNVTIESERAGIITENIQLVKELYLESIYQKTPTQGFYCPNCKSCIQKILILDTEPDVPPQPLPPFDRFRCPTCYSFLILIGGWLCPPRKPDPPPSYPPSGGATVIASVGSGTDPRPPYPPSDISGYPQGPGGATGIASVGSGTDPRPPYPPSDISGYPQGPGGATGIASVGSGTDPPPPYPPSDIPGYPQGPGGATGIASVGSGTDPRPPYPPSDISGYPQGSGGATGIASVGSGTEPSPTPTPTIPTPDPTIPVQEPGSSKAWDILKSFVYGGLNESIASLGVVTSSASADATTLSILSLSVANVIGGLFILVHHIWDLKSEQQATNEHVDRYVLSLGKRENFYLHVCIAILSFIIFGFVPPLAYGLTFYETNEKDLTLVAVAGASIICITLLSIAKTYVQRPNAYLPYLQTVISYLSAGALTSIIAYLVGVLIRKLLEKLGFSSESSLAFNLMQPEMSFIEKPRFGSY